MEISFYLQRSFYFLDQFFLYFLFYFIVCIYCWPKLFKWSNLFNFFIFNMIGIVMPETCWAYKKYNKIISCIQLVLILLLRVILCFSIFLLTEIVEQRRHHEFLNKLHISFVSNHQSCKIITSTARLVCTSPLLTHALVSGSKTFTTVNTLYLGETSEAILTRKYRWHDVTSHQSSLSDLAGYLNFSAWLMRNALFEQKKWNNGTGFCGK